jgi:hypothetical protein
VVSAAVSVAADVVDSTVLDELAVVADADSAALAAVALVSAAASLAASVAAAASEAVSSALAAVSVTVSVAVDPVDAAGSDAVWVVLEAAASPLSGAEAVLSAAASVVSLVVVSTAGAEAVLSAAASVVSLVVVSTAGADEVVVVAGAVVWAPEDVDSGPVFPLTVILLGRRCPRLRARQYRLQLRARGDSDRSFGDHLIRLTVLTLGLRLTANQVRPGKLRRTGRYCGGGCGERRPRPDR